ncbi:uncharacterized protein LDX57_004161 [Aspergillus melleus]|uniref:uncharacterized protein n=1 Tax=Aspergillus melleus TaxID=138277 RepID=UPI001E8DC506|nr:uncharacterized protein LDX57_004161 [Aspergillus melleus]KAH8426423.1 hypothetical protein LDX57_004161 [Aspergillus melleus]
MSGRGPKPNESLLHDGSGKGQENTIQNDQAEKNEPNADQKRKEKDSKVKVDLSEEPAPKGPWGDRGVTSGNAGMYRVPENSSTLNVRINLDLRADVALELHAVVQGSVIIGLF